jgi:peptide deformylase
MIEFAASMNALGLAAPQVDYGLRLIVVRSSWGNYIILRNPRIMHAYRHNHIAVEGCLSLPGKLYAVPRAMTVQVKYEGGEQDFTGTAARVIQHELDHLDGILISDRGTPVEAN